MLSVSHLSVTVQDQPLLQDISFSLEAGQCLCIIGESGSGKTTLLRTLQGLIPFQRGTIEFSLAGQGLRQLRPEQAFLGLPSSRWVMQNPLSALNPQQAIGQAITESLYASGLSGHEQQRKLTAALQQVGLSDDFAMRKPHQLSIGQAQRACIARALIAEPELIIFDEPLAALDAVVQKQLARQLWQIQQQRGLSYLFVTHDLGFAYAYADQILLLQQGRIASYQSVDDFFHSPSSDYGQQLIEAASILGSLPLASEQPLQATG